MSEENIVLCGANSYDKKYYLNEIFSSLPDPIKKELQIMCVIFTEEVGGVLILEYNNEMNLCLKVHSDIGDFLFDEIGAELKIKQLRNEKRELFESLEMYYRIWREQNAISN